MSVASATAALCASISWFTLSACRYIAEEASANQWEHGNVTWKKQSQALTLINYLCQQSWEKCNFSQYNIP
jgi:hypothetical protein